MIVTTEDVVNHILDIDNESDQARGEGVPADALVMVKKSEDGTMFSIDSMEYEPSTKTLWLNVSEY